MSHLQLWLGWQGKRFHLQNASSLCFFTALLCSGSAVTPVLDSEKDSGSAQSGKESTAPPVGMSQPCAIRGWALARSDSHVLWSLLALTALGEAAPSICSSLHSILLAWCATQRNYLTEPSAESSQLHISSAAINTQHWGSKRDISPYLNDDTQT